jgi:formylglycine-generating enzyme required for sulfatase activity
MKMSKQNYFNQKSQSTSLLQRWKQICLRGIHQWPHLFFITLMLWLCQQSLQAQALRPIRVLITQIQIQNMPEKQAELSQFFNFLIPEKLKLYQEASITSFNSEQALALLNQDFDLSKCEQEDCAYQLANEIGADISLKSNLFWVDGKYHLYLSLNAITPNQSLAQIEKTAESTEQLSAQLEAAINLLFVQAKSNMNEIQKTKVRYKSTKHATEAEQAQWARLGIQWIRINAGELQFGSEVNAEESPIVKLQVPTLLVMKNEVTVAQYFQCVTAGRCTVTARDEGCFSLNAMDQRPVNCVTWEQAKIFANWIGARLPSEAEWEWVSKGKEQRKYPWGEESASCLLAVMKEGGLDGCGIEQANVTCSKPRGNTPDGVCDLGGNVWEWVEDDWFANHKGTSKANARIKDQGKASNLKVYKGGSWYHESRSLRSASRGKLAGNRYSVGVGFRCVL